MHVIESCEVKDFKRGTPHIELYYTYVQLSHSDLDGEDYTYCR